MTDATLVEIGTAVMAVIATAGIAAALAYVLIAAIEGKRK